METILYELSQTVGQLETKNSKDIEEVVKMFLNVVEELKNFIDNHIVEVKNEVYSNLGRSTQTFSEFEGRTRKIIDGAEGTSLSKIKEISQTLISLSKEIKRIEAIIPKMPNLDQIEGKLSQLEKKDFGKGIIEKINKETEQTRKRFGELEGRIILNGKKATGSGSRPIRVYNNGTEVSQNVLELNFTNPSSISTTGKVGRRVNITTGGGSIAASSGVVNGVNQTFVFLNAPNLLCVDGVVKRKTQSDGVTANWTGTTTIVLTIAPVFDIFAIG